MKNWHVISVILLCALFALCTDKSIGGQGSRPMRSVDADSAMVGLKAEILKTKIECAEFSRLMKARIHEVEKRAKKKPAPVICPRPVDTIRVVDRPHIEGL